MLQVIHPNQSWFCTPCSQQSAVMSNKPSKRKADAMDEVDLDALHPAKRAAGPIMHAGPNHTGDLAVVPMDSDLQVSGASQDLPHREGPEHQTSTAAAAPAAGIASASGQELQPLQSSVPSTCTDIVLYKPAAVVVDPAAAHAQLQRKLPVLQQQPNALAMLWRSLTPMQRRSLAGMWDALRDEKMLGGMLMKLPPQQQAEEAEQFAAGSSPGCVVEELHDTLPGTQQQQLCSAAVAAASQIHSQAAVATAGGMISSTAAASNGPPQLMAGGAAGNAVTELDQMQQAGWQWQQQQQQEQQQETDGSAPMDIEE